MSGPTAPSFLGLGALEASRAAASNVSASVAPSELHCRPLSSPTTCPALAPVRPSRLAIRSRTGRAPEQRSNSWNDAASYQWALVLPSYPAPPFDMVIALFAHVRAPESFGISGPKAISIFVPVRNSGAGVALTLAPPSARGPISRRFPWVVMMSRPPPDAISEPATTLNPFPNAPRCGLRHCLVERSGRSIENRFATSWGDPSMPGPSSAMR
jgi:hypothetical protein